MPNQDSNKEKPVEDKADQTLAQTVEAFQERARGMGFVSNGSDDKAIMDEAWGGNSSDAEGLNLEALHTAIENSPDSDLPIPTDHVFAELRARNAASSGYRK